MSVLIISEQTATKLGEVEDLSLALILKALKGTVETDADEVKMAVKMLGVVAKNRQTAMRRMAVEFGMAASVATKEQLKSYITATNPVVQKALGKPKKIA